MKKIKLGSHFDGIAGFPLAASRAEIEAVWATEIEKFPIQVSKKHFPKMIHLGSITDMVLCVEMRHPGGIKQYLNDAQDRKVSHVDLITFGSPCQDLSVAGKRAGLEGERSGLFMEAIRTIREMREATDGVYPRFALWENVPGALSSNEGRDFRAVLEAFTETEIPMPPSGRWADAGMVRGNGREIAWRCLDAQYWGVPQRRKRIFLVADFGGQRAGEILFESEGVSGDSQEGRKAREEVAACAGDGIEATGYALIGHSEYSQGVGTLRAKGGDCAGGSETLITHPQITGTLCASGAGMSRPAGMASETDLLVAQCVTTGTGRRYDPESETLIPVLHDQGGNRMDISFNLAPTLRAQSHAHEPIVAHAVDYRNMRETVELSGTLQAKAHGYSVNFQNPVRIGYAVRRLTPLECERLQGLPDYWTDLNYSEFLDLVGIEIVSSKTNSSDTARYKAIGNGLAIPCPEWILKRMANVLRGLPVMEDQNAKNQTE